MSDLRLVVLEAGKRKARSSASSVVDFTSVRIGSSFLEIKEDTGAFDFSAKNIVNVGTVDGVDVSALKTQSDGVVDDVGNLVTLSGVAVDSTDLGTFSGSVIPDTQTIKQALQALETAVETATDDQIADEVAYTPSVLTDWDGDADPGSTKDALDQLAERVDDNEIAISSNTSHASGDGSDHQDVVDLVTLSGSAANSTNHGAFSGATLSDTETTRSALQALETSLEEVDVNANDLITLSGVAENASDLGTFTGSVIADSLTIKQALQSLETKTENNTSLIQNFEFQNSALDFVTDNTAVPATEVSGDRYILSDAGGAPHANWDGASAGDIVEFNGTTWDATTPTVGMFIAADDESNVLYLWGGASWSSKAFESTTASTGLTKSAFDIQLADAGASNGIVVSSGAISAVVDDSSIEISGTAIAIKALGVDTAELAADAVDGTKIADDAVAKEHVAADVAGTGIRQNTNGSLERDDARSFTNDNAGAITIRQIVYIKSDGDVDLAKADAAATSDVKLGIVEDASIASTASGSIIIRKGAIIGGFAGLVPGADQFISPSTAGLMTPTAPTTSGQWFRKIGEAISTTEIEFNPEEAIEIV